MLALKFTTKLKVEVPVEFVVRNQYSMYVFLVHIENTFHETDLCCPSSSAADFLSPLPCIFIQVLKSVQVRHGGADSVAVDGADLLETAEGWGKVPIFRNYNVPFKMSFTNEEQGTLLHVLRCSLLYPYHRNLVPLEKELPHP